MQELDGKVAVVTGAASGMGLAFAQRFAREGMRVVLGDIEQGALDAAVTALRREERDVLGVRVDVSSQESVDVLANETLDRYGAVHVLCNNAGVAAESDWSALRADGRVAGLWEHSLADWRWTFDVNFWGVVHGIRTFLPIMLEQGEAGHVVNTASMAGFTGGSDLAIYGATKFAVVRITEALHLQLEALGAPIKASALCPGMISTGIFRAHRNRPGELWSAEQPPESDAARREAVEATGRRFATEGLPPEDVAEMVLEGIREERFYIFTHANAGDAIRERMERIIARDSPAERTPTR